MDVSESGLGSCLQFDRVYGTGSNQRYALLCLRSSTSSTNWLNLNTDDESGACAARQPAIALVSLPQCVEKRLVHRIDAPFGCGCGCGMHPNAVEQHEIKQGIAIDQTYGSYGASQFRRPARRTSSPPICSMTSAMQRAKAWKLRASSCSRSSRRTSWD